MIAIDGPSGSGKSTVARLLAERIGYRFLDSGAMYRAAALKALRNGVPADAASELAELLFRTEIELDRDRVLLDGEDVTAAIRTPEVTEFVSRLATVPEVRSDIVARQRAAHPGENLVVEGRDIGSVVFPDATLKVFLTASPEERARRRAAETGREFAAVLEEQGVRDARDSGRAHSPLKKAEGAFELDTDGLGIEEVVKRLTELIARSPRD